MQMEAIPRKRILPQNYLECLMEKGRALTLHQHHERKLANALGVLPSELPVAIDKMRSGSYDVSLAMMYGNFLRAEQELDAAIELYEKAVELHYNKSFRGIDE